MKKGLVIIILIFIVIMCLLASLLLNNTYTYNEIKQANSEYEQYLDQELTGINVATIINKVMDANKKNKVPKNESGFYIDNQTDSIKIEIKMITVEKTIEMESIYNKDMTEFVQHFSKITFKCSNIEYHKNTGRISKIIFEELEEEQIY